MVPGMEQHIAAILRHGRANAAVDQFLDLGDDFGGFTLIVTLGMTIFAIVSVIAGQKGLSTGFVMVQNGRKRRWFQFWPIGIARFGERDEIGTEKHPCNPVNAEQASGQRRHFRCRRARELDGTPRKDFPPGQEFQGLGIGGRLGFDEHGVTSAESGEYPGQELRLCPRKTSPPQQAREGALQF